MRFSVSIGRFFGVTVVSQKLVVGRFADYALAVVVDCLRGVSRRNVRGFTSLIASNMVSAAAAAGARRTKLQDYLPRSSAAQGP